MNTKLVVLRRPMIAVAEAPPPRPKTPEEMTEEELFVAGFIPHGGTNIHDRQVIWTRGSESVTRYRPAAQMNEQDRERERAHRESQRVALRAARLAQQPRPGGTGGKKQKEGADKKGGGKKKR